MKVGRSLKFGHLRTQRVTLHVEDGSARRLCKIGYNGREKGFYISSEQLHLISIWSSAVADKYKTSKYFVKLLSILPELLGVFAFHLYNDKMVRSSLRDENLAKSYFGCLFSCNLSDLI